LIEIYPADFLEKSSKEDANPCQLPYQKKQGQEI
jgi:hypothetical protein